VYRTLIRLAPLFLAALSLVACQRQTTELYRSVLRVITLPLLTSYTPIQTLDDQGNPVQLISGFDHDLATLFAESLDREPVFTVANSYDDLVSQLKSGKADMAAAWLPKTFIDGQGLSAGPTYGWMQPVLLRRARVLPQHRMEQSANNNQAASTANISSEIKQIQSLALPELYPSNPAITALICSDTSAEIATSVFPNLSIHATKEKKQEVVWAFAPPSADTEKTVPFKSEAEAFLKDLNARGRMSQIRDKHFGALRKLPTRDKLAFLERSQAILPIYEPLFKQAQQETGVDWRLIASLGYQESHWNPQATSPTGVRGIMMLTEGTSALLGVRDRLDPAEAIPAGARYLKQLRRNVKGRISEPDRTWMALAGYNQGPGNLIAARNLAKKYGLNPGSWYDVKLMYPLLARTDFTANLKTGTANGQEAVTLAERVRMFYTLLAFHRPLTNP
jgi:membrane-bound lytic murein transglycosylase F